MDDTNEHSPADKVLTKARELLGPFDVLDRATGYRLCALDDLPAMDKIGENGGSHR